MAQARLSVRKIRDVLRLKNEAHLSDRQIGAVLGSARSTVQECLKRARLAGLSRPLPAELDDVDYAGKTMALVDRHTGRLKSPRCSSPLWARATTLTSKRA